MKNMSISKEKFLDLLQKMPGAAQYFNQFQTLSGMYSSLTKIISEDLHTGNRLTDDEIDLIMSDFVNLFEEADKKVISIESKRKYEMRTFKFDTSKILEHSRLIDKISSRIYYLNYILKEYSAHEQLRINMINEIFNQKIKEDSSFIEKFTSALFSMSDVNDGSSKHLMMPKIEPGLREQVINELNYLTSLNKNSMEDLLEEIDNPPSVRKRFGDDHEMVENHNDEFMSVKEICEYLKISRSNFYNKRNEHELTSYRLGKIVRYKKSDIDELLKISEKTV